MTHLSVISQEISRPTQRQIKTEPPLDVPRIIGTVSVVPDPDPIVQPLFILQDSESFSQPLQLELSQDDQPLREIAIKGEDDPYPVIVGEDSETLQIPVSQDDYVESDIEWPIAQTFSLPSSPARPTPTTPMMTPTEWRTSAASRRGESTELGTSAASCPAQMVSEPRPTPTTPLSTPVWTSSSPAHRKRRVKTETDDTVEGQLSPVSALFESSLPVLYRNVKEQPPKKKARRRLLPVHLTSEEELKMRKEKLAEKEELEKAKKERAEERKRKREEKIKMQEAKDKNKQKSKKKKPTPKATPKKRKTKVLNITDKTASPFFKGSIVSNRKQKEYPPGECLISVQRKINKT